MTISEIVAEMAKERGIYGDAYATAEMAMDRAEEIAREVGAASHEVVEWALQQRDGK